MDVDLRHLQLQTLLSQTAIGMAATDASGRMTLLSPALQRLFLLPAEPLLSEEEFADRFHLYDEDGLEPLADKQVPLTRARAGELVRDQVVTARLTDHGLIHLRCNAAPLRDTDGTICGAICLVQDITAERTAQLEQEELRRRLVETISHEFRTPLAVLLGHAELLQGEESELSEASSRALAKISAAGWQLRDLLQVISELVDLESHTRLVKSYGDLGALASEVVADFGHAATAEGIGLRCTAVGSLRATVDSAKVRDAVGALVQNALTHSLPGGEVVVTSSDAGDMVRIEVADAGRGIDPDDRERLMQPLAPTGDREAGVTRGLGLAVARTVAVAHGGWLTLDDRSPQGLLAALVLPRHGTLSLSEAAVIS